MLKKISREGNLFKAKLCDIVNLNHPLCVFGEKIDWQNLENQLISLYDPDHGRPAVPIRLMSSLIYLKMAYDVSDEEVIERWFENPYWQYFSGMDYFETELPMDSSSMSRFRKRLKSKEMEPVLESAFYSALKKIDINGFGKTGQNVNQLWARKKRKYNPNTRLFQHIREKFVKFAGKLLKKT